MNGTHLFALRNCVIYSKMHQKDEINPNCCCPLISVINTGLGHRDQRVVCLENKRTKLTLNQQAV